MADDTYTLTELARLADVTPRTVRYYVQRGLLPSPDPAGPATRYGDRHLLRLRAIRLLQRDHLPLAEIRARLERMDDTQLEATLRGTSDAAPEPAASTEETLAFVRALMTRAGVAPRFYAPPVPLAREAYAPPAPDEFPIREEPGPPFAPGSPLPGRPAPGEPERPDRSRRGRPDPARPAPADLPGGPRIAVPLPPLQAPAASPLPAVRSGTDRSTWERIAITADVEIHVRRPLDRPRNKRLEQLARIARELFTEDA